MWRLKKIFVLYIPILFLLCAIQQSGFAFDKCNATSFSKEKKVTVEKKSCCATDLKCKMACCKSKIIRATACEKKSSKNPTKKTKTCDDGCGDTRCCCSPSFSFAAVSTTPIEIKLKKPFFFLSPKAGWYFPENITKSVYLAIWLPPKISRQAIG